MVITKGEMQHILDTMPDKIDVKEVFDKILVSAKIEQALDESDRGLGEDWQAFQIAWLNED